MKTEDEVLQISSEAEGLLQSYFSEIKKTLMEGQASQTESNKIINELREHFLQAYWKETGSKFVKADELQKILNTMGNPREIASEYLVDWEARSDQAPAPRFEAEGSLNLRLSSLETFVAQHKVFFILILPIILFIGLYGALILLFSFVRDGWLIFVIVGDIILLTPLVWYWFRWKTSTDLTKWNIVTPRRMRSYFLLEATLILLGGLLLPFLRGTADCISTMYDYKCPYMSSFTLEGRNYDSGRVDAAGWDLHVSEFWIREEFILLMNLIQLALVVLFLVATLRTSISWEQADVKVELLNVRLPELVDDTGLIRIHTTNKNPITFAQVRMKLLDQSKDLQSVIDPPVRAPFGLKDAVGWIIRFTPKNAGILAFGRFVLQLDSNLTVCSPKYHFRVEHRDGTPPDSVSPSKSAPVIDFPVALDLFGTCGICKQSFQKTELVSFCTSCGSLFHHHHLQEWLKGHDACPNCARPIKIPEKNRNYSHLVSERLEQLEIECQRLIILLESSETL